MNRRNTGQLIVCAGCAALGWFGGNLLRDPIRPAKAAAITRTAEEPVSLAAPGRVEGASDPVDVAAGIEGLLSAVLVHEGQHVRAGDLIATVERRELNGELAQAQAAVEIARAEKARLLRGSRDEERRQAAAEVARAAAVLEEARTNYSRQAKLLVTDDVPAATADRARSDMDSAKATFDAAVDRQKLVNAPPLPEDLGRADAQIIGAEDRVRTVAATIAKCQVRAPVSGTVTHRFLEPGEAVSFVFPQPIVSIVDSSKVRVRAEVDERDIARVRVGQSVIVTADSLGAHSASGRVASAGASMGRKRVRTGDPGEKNDRDVLEVLVDVTERDPRLVLGLRVTVQFLGEQSELKRNTAFFQPLETLATIAPTSLCYLRTTYSEDSRGQL